MFTDYQVYVNARRQEMERSLHMATLQGRVVRDSGDITSSRSAMTPSVVPSAAQGLPAREPLPRHSHHWSLRGR